jgi:hypothetical protein
MASAEVLTEEIIAELGKDNPQIRSQVRTNIGDIAIDLLSQNEGEFSCLEKYEDIPLTVNNSEFLLTNGDFKRAKKKSILIDANGLYVGEIHLVSNNEFFNRQANSEQYPGTTYARIEYKENGADGSGNYLIFGTTYTTAATLRFSYYRQPTGSDVMSISNTSLIKVGVRMMMSNQKPEWANSGAIYYGLRQSFKENIEDRATELVLRPPKKKEAYNRMMHDIGRGE